MSRPGESRVRPKIDRTHYIIRRAGLFCGFLQFKMNTDLKDNRIIVVTEEEVAPSRNPAENFCQSPTVVHCYSKTIRDYPLQFLRCEI